MLAIASLLAVIAVSLVITRVATVVLVATGMSGQTARFQARSAFTGAGFTTSESEEVVAHPVRRRVIMALMLLGNAGIVAAASTLILGFRGGAAGNDWIRVMELVGGLIVLVLASRNSHIDRRLTAWIRAILRRFTDLPGLQRDYLLELGAGRVVAELHVDPAGALAGRSLARLRLAERGATVLGVQRGDAYDDDLSGASVLEGGDTIVVYAPRDVIDDLDPGRPPAG